MDFASSSPLLWRYHAPHIRSQQNTGESETNGWLTRTPDTDQTLLRWRSHLRPNKVTWGVNAALANLTKVQVMKSRVQAPHK